MDKFVIAAIIAGLFILAKVIEAKFIKKEDTPLKKVSKDGLIVYAASLAGIYIAEEFTFNDARTESPGAYTGSPEF